MALRAEELIKSARESTGLTNWGQGPEVERWLSLLLQDYNQYQPPADLRDYISERFNSRLLTALTGRLRLASKQPEAEPLHKRPLFILGLPRSGTTFLQELLRQQPGWRAPTTIEALYPLESAEGGRAAKVAEDKARHFSELINTRFPTVAAMHNFHPDAVEENCMLMEPSLMSYSLCLSFPAPNYATAFEEADKAGAWQLLLRVLNILSDDRRWVLKDPQHTAFIGGFLEAIPSDVVWLHRDPVAMVISGCRMLSGARRMSDSEKAQLGPKLLKKTRKTLRATRQAMEGYPRLLHVGYDELVADPISTAERIVSFVGDEFQPAAIEKWLRQDSKHPFKQSAYAPEEFGLTPRLITETLEGLW